MNHWPSTCAGSHLFEPVEKMRAVYRCVTCGGFAYKGSIRTDIGSSTDLHMYKCFVKGCTDRAVVIYPIVKGKRRQQPSCPMHRKDKPHDSQA